MKYRIAIAVGLIAVTFAAAYIPRGYIKRGKVLRMETQSKIAEVTSSSWTYCLISAPLETGQDAGNCLVELYGAGYEGGDVRWRWCKPKE